MASQPTLMVTQSSPFDTKQPVTATSLQPSGSKPSVFGDHAGATMEALWKRTRRERVGTTAQNGGLSTVMPSTRTPAQPSKRTANGRTAPVGVGSPAHLGAHQSWPFSSTAPPPEDTMATSVALAAKMKGAYCGAPWSGSGSKPAGQSATPRAERSTAPSPSSSVSAVVWERSTRPERYTPGPGSSTTRRGWPLLLSLLLLLLQLAMAAAMAAVLSVRASPLPPNAVTSQTRAAGGSGGGAGSVGATALHAGRRQPEGTGFSSSGRGLPGCCKSQQSPWTASGNNASRAPRMLLFLSLTK